MRMSAGRNWSGVVVSVILALLVTMGCSSGTADESETSAPILQGTDDRQSVTNGDDGTHDSVPTSTPRSEGAMLPNAPVEESEGGSLLDSLSLLAAIATILGFIVALSPSAASSVERLRRRRNGQFWHIAPLVRPQPFGVAEAVAAKGRVPHTCKIEGSVVSVLWNVGRWLMLRPSSPKTAFAITSWEQDPMGDEPVMVDGLPRHGYRLRVTLHRHENAKHFERSFKARKTTSARVIAICDPEQLEKSAGPIRCHSIESINIVALSNGDDGGALCTLVSADPEWHPKEQTWERRPNRQVWDSTRGRVPDDAIWLVTAPEETSVCAATAPPHESEHARQVRNRYSGTVIVTLLSLPLFALVLLSLPLGLSFWINTGGDGIGQQILVAILELMWVVFGIFESLGIVAFALYVIGYFIAKVRERGESRKLQAGTTECVLDGRKIRYGHTSDEN